MRIALGPRLQLASNDFYLFPKCVPCFVGFQFCGAPSTTAFNRIYWTIVLVVWAKLLLWIAPDLSD